MLSEVARGYGCVHVYWCVTSCIDECDRDCAVVLLHGGWCCHCHMRRHVVVVGCSAQVVCCRVELQGGHCCCGEGLCRSRCSVEVKA